ncbi:ABC transporter ATP-binding protein [Spartinivicinus poritis]|uniref:ABC transporter ATP-binding protein n=1 Tax=Spartinivicinus poritis TaxID=2994640 RepID=A0ABT5UFL6_9GAMM|nr:ABC transporter ATP-binding protein [Spartinivicinus sp. A2-2]MDE1465172.1 ABC transporter ATP-binding protein [Spartinivicinus sp. A2-2]
MLCDSIAIKIENLAKDYKVYKKPEDKLKEMLFSNFFSLFKIGTKKYYEVYTALKSVSFEVKKGEIVGILGKNGCGKSTLLQIICGTLPSTEGNVVVSGKVAALLELGVGFNPEYTGIENIYFYASILGLTNKQIEKKINRIIEFADIGDFINQPVKTYSSGMYVRLAFSVIAHVDADILIIDEALAVGDAFFIQKCMRFIREFIKKGRTILFVSHDINSVINLCNKAVWIDNGIVKKIGDPKSISNDYLAELYNSSNTNEKSNEVNSKDYRSKLGIKSETTYDIRRKLLITSNLRNDLEIFSFNDESKSFGCKGAVITDVMLLTSDKENICWTIGGEQVILYIEGKSLINISKPIIGFCVKDKLGQHIFGDNTYLAYINKSVSLKENDLFSSEFAFNMPILPAGDYSISVAIADGDQSSHQQHHWIHDAIIFKSHSSSISSGLVGIPMQSIKLHASSMESSYE